MRRFAIGTVLVLGLAAAGCEKPEQGLPNPTGGASSGSSASSGVSSGEDLSVEMPPAAGDKSAVDAAPATENSAPPADPAKPADDAPATEENKQSSSGKAGAVKFVADTSMKVPTMSCPHGCWPTVKETLAAQPGVEAVELAKQSSDDAIDNPVVYIKLNGKFDSEAAAAALAKAGFENAEVVN